jgi:single-stranded DNA-binding protein
MITALVQGTLFRAPEQRTSKAGKPFVMATLRVKEGETSHFVRLVAFGNTAQTELMRLCDGDAISVQGPFKAETYVAADGSTKISLSILADAVLALRPPPRDRKPKAAPKDARPKQERQRGSWRDERDGPCDEIPF